MLTPSLAIARALQKDIAFGRYPVGVTLPTAQEVAVRFGCGLVCAHNALSTLEKAGVIAMRDGRAVVHSLEASSRSGDGLDRESLRSIVEFMQAVEPAAAALAALTVGEVDVQRLNALHAQLREACRQENAEEAATLDIQFHLSIAEMSGNGVVKDTLQRELPLVVFFRGDEARVRADIRQSMEDHAALLEALRTRDAAGASASMQAHVAHIAQRLGISSPGTASPAADVMAAPAAPPIDRPVLTQRELDCLRWFAAGKTAWETGKILNISEWTVVYHLGKLKQKLGVSSKRQLVGRAIALGFVEN